MEVKQMPGEAFCNTTTGVGQCDIPFWFRMSKSWNDKCITTDHDRHWCYVHSPDNETKYWRNCNCSKCPCEEGEYTRRIVKLLPTVSNFTYKAIQSNDYL